MTKELLSPHYKVFVEWMATPVLRREADEHSFTDWCTKRKVPTDVALKFYEQPNFFEDVHQQAVRWGMSRVPDYLEMLDTKIKKSGSTKDIMAFIDIMEKLSKKGKVDRSVVFNIPMDRAEEIINRTNN